MNKLTILPAGAALLLTLACGGGGGSSGTPAKQLAYTDPSTTSGWRLQLDPASPPSPTTHVVLDLLPPANITGNAVTVLLTVNPAVAKWSYVAGTSYATQTPFATTPPVDVAGVQGGALGIVLGQPVTAAPVSFGDGTTMVVQVALDLATGADTGDAGLAATQGGFLGAAGPVASITVAAGSLEAK
ncbi:MAG: hypothetical protein ABSH53_24345 [Holophaga sp.]|jgi:hypothetical protein